MSDAVIYKQSDAVATVTLNRPERLNAWNGELVDGLRDAIERAGSKSVRCVVITGAGRAFSSGADLEEASQRAEASVGGPKASDILRESYHPILLGIRELEKPVIAAVNGVAAGIGCSLALACDLIWAKSSAAFLLPFVNIGLVPDGGSTAFLPAAVGRARAFEISLLGEPLAAAKAVEYGLINRALEDEEFQQRVDELAVRLAQGSSLAYASTKRALNHSTLPQLESSLELEAGLQDACLASDDFREGVAAFLEKRKPAFTRS